MPPIEGNPISAEAQDEQSFVLQAAASADGNGTTADLFGMNGAQMCEIVNASTGTATLTLEGSYDRVNWYAIGYYQNDNTATLARAVAGIAVTNASKHVYQILDLYRYVRGRISGTAGSTAITATIYAVPQ